MAFWSWQRGGRTSINEGSSALESTSTLEPVHVFCTDGEIKGFIAPAGRRVTDLLNDSDSLQIQVAAGAGATDRNRWVTITRDPTVEPE